MFLAAYVPSVWFNLMDKRVIQVAGNDSDKINFMPAKREKLIERYKLKQSASGAQTAL
jgi:alkane 1-monooxygenase